MIIAHGFPSGVRGAAAAAASLPELGDRIANELGWLVLVPALRGAGQSEGHFSLGGWLDDIVAAIAHLRATERPGGIWLAGFGTGGALSHRRRRPRPGDQGRRRPRCSRPTSTTGPASPGGCSSTPARSA